MHIIWHHYRRYLSWAAIGACASALPITWLIYKNPSREIVPLVCISTGLGGMVLVTCRYITGLVSGRAATAGDRLTAILIGLFTIGFLLAIGVMSGLIAIAGTESAIHRLLIQNQFVLAIGPLGGIAMMLAGPLVWRRRGYLIFWKNMPIVWSHFRRYVCWAVFGSALLTLPFALLIGHDKNYGALLIPVGAGGIVMVVSRVVVSLVTRRDGIAADRRTAILVGRFMIGWILGIGTSLAVIAIADSKSELGRLLTRNGTFVLFWPLGGVAMMLTGSLFWRRHGYLILPLAWFAAMAILMACWVLGISLLVG